MAEAQQDTRRMTKLQQVLEKVLTMSVDSFTFRDMHACFPELAQQHGNLLSSFCADLLQGIRANVKSEFDAIAGDYKLPQALSRLDQASDAQPKSMKTGRRRLAALSTSPNTLLRNHSVRQKQGQLTELQQNIQQLQQRNAKAKADDRTRFQAMQAKVQELQDIRVEIEKQAKSTGAVFT